MNRAFPGRGRGSRRRALFMAVAVLVAAAGGSLAFLVFYWMGRGTAALGVSLAVALTGMGTGLVFWSHGLMSAEEVSGEREPLASSADVRQEFREGFFVGEERMGRRRLLGWMAGGVLALLGIGSLSLIKSLGKSPLPELFKAVWDEGARLVTADGRPVSTDLAPGSVLNVFPEGAIGATVSQTLLMRVDESLLDMPPERTDWTPKGFIAFSKICTHAGCPVGQYEKDVNLLLCPCHQSAFDILRGALPVSGPAGRALPQLPMFEDEEGNLRARGDFSEPPGPSFWGLH